MSLVWNWPQIVWLGLVAFGFGVRLVQGEQIGFGIVGTIVSICLLYFGGFWAGAAP